jgi:hypothetical protein
MFIFNPTTDGDVVASWLCILYKTVDFFWLPTQRGNKRPYLLTIRRLTVFTDSHVSEIHLPRASIEFSNPFFLAFSK